MTEDHLVDVSQRRMTTYSSNWGKVFRSGKSKFSERQRLSSTKFTLSSLEYFPSML